MARKRAASEYRNVIITFTDGGSSLIPIDAMKSAIVSVETMEDKYASLGAEGQPDLTSAVVFVSGTVPHQIHLFTVTSVMANSTYAFVYDETRPNPTNEL
tara:strand:+ start:2013 stop:2312 length:300 start_codon:yes stop_codon:yes gene_type:complete